MGRLSARERGLVRFRSACSPSLDSDTAAELAVERFRFEVSGDTLWLFDQNGGKTQYRRE